MVMDLISSRFSEQKRRVFFSLFTVASFAVSSDLLAAKYLEVDETQNQEDQSDYHISVEEHQLLDLIDTDLNFIDDHPCNVMSAAQIIYAMILDQGVSHKNLPGYGQIPIYSMFSHSNSVTGGRRIVGQYEGIKAVVDGIESQARGSKTGVKVPLLVGIHGTGKTEFRTVIANALRNLTRSNSKYHIHEVSWILKELSQIPEIKNYIKIYQGAELKSPLHSSPVSILPDAYKKLIKAKSRVVIDEILGSYPVFDMEPDPLSKSIRDSILKYFISASDSYVEETLKEIGVERNREKGFSALDEMKILNKFMTIRRVILGDPGTVPLIDAQGDEIDFQGLIMSENPIFRMLAGASDVWSWSYNGAVLSGSRNFIFLDEFFRNEATLRDMFLGILESRVVTRGGSPAVPVDAVIVAATNSANLNKAMSDSKSHAQVNRMRQIPFEWTTHPGEIAKILLYMNGKGLRMKKLPCGKPDEGAEEEKECSYENIDIDLLYPEIENSTPMLSPDGRYKLVFGDNEDEGVFISPHTLSFMADFIATTRMNTSTKEATQLMGQEQVIGDPIFREPLTRLKVLKNELPILGAKQQELYKLSKKLREGSYGMSSRVAGTWFSESLNEAKEIGNDSTLTPVILRKVYDRLLNEGTLEVGDIPTELKWKALMDMIAEGSLIPKMQKDIFSSFHDDQRVEDIYDEIIAEILALNIDKDATVFETFSGKTMHIGRKRLAQIKKIYHKNTGRPLENQQLAMLYLQLAPKSSRERPSKNKDLIEAISEYLANSLDPFINVKDLLDYSENSSGNSAIVEKFRSVEYALINKLGYNKRSVSDSLRIIKQYQEKLEQ